MLDETAGQLFWGENATPGQLPGTAMVLVYFTWCFFNPAIAIPDRVQK